MGIQSDRTTHMMKTFHTLCLLVATMTKIQAQYSPSSGHGVATNIVNGISGGLVGHGITHGTADIVPVSNGVLMVQPKSTPSVPILWLRTMLVPSLWLSLTSVHSMLVTKLTLQRVTASSVTLSMMDPPPSQRLYHKDSHRSLDTRADQMDFAANALDCCYKMQDHLYYG